MPQLGQRVEIRLIGSIKAVEQTQAEGVTGALGDLDMDVTEVKIFPVSNFSKLLED